MIKSKINKKKTSVYSIIKLASFTIFIVIFIFIIYELYESNTIKKIFINNIEKFSQNQGYFLSEVKINKLVNIKSEEIKKHFLKYYGRSIFLIPINKISKDLYQNKWIKDFTIRNDYKSAISINIVEKEPIGIYFNRYDNFLFDENGDIIDFLNPNFNLYSNLIKFEGNNSILNANIFLNSIPLLFRNEIDKAIFVGNRRWNVELNSGIILKLSESNILDSLKNYDKFYKNVPNQELRNIEMIDLRIPKQIILRFKEQKND